MPIRLFSFPAYPKQLFGGRKYFYQFVDGKGGAPGGVDGDYDVWGPYFNGQLSRSTIALLLMVLRQGTPYVARGKDNLKNFLQTGYQTNNNVALGSVGDNYVTRFRFRNSTKPAISHRNIWI
jgi:hypothetical protein